MATLWGVADVFMYVDPAPCCLDRARRTPTAPGDPNRSAGSPLHSWLSRLEFSPEPARCRCPRMTDLDGTARPVHTRRPLPHHALDSRAAHLA